jgi:hypothetical protein
VNEATPRALESCVGGIVGVLRGLAPGVRVDTEVLDFRM